MDKDNGFRDHSSKGIKSLLEVRKTNKNIAIGDKVYNMIDKVMSKDIKIRVFIDSDEFQSSFVAIQENKETENGSSVLKQIAQEYDRWVAEQRLDQSLINNKEKI